MPPAPDFVAVLDGLVVATLRVLARQIAGLASELRLAGFGAVASDSAVRGQGYVRRLLATAHERNRCDGYDLAILFTRSPWVHSDSAGFSVLPFSWLDVDVRRVPRPSAPGDAAFALAAEVRQNSLLAPCARMGGRLPRDHVLGDAGHWSMRDSTIFRAYSCRQAVTGGAARSCQSAERVLVWRRLLVLAMPRDGTALRSRG